MGKIPVCECSVYWSGWSSSGGCCGTTPGNSGNIERITMSATEECRDLRTAIREIGKKVKALMDHEAMAHNRPIKVDVGEMKANIMLSYRHLEDARMRLGKVIQAEDGGTSVYDK